MLKNAIIGFMQGIVNIKGNAMTEGKTSALEAQYQHLATKADIERLGKELGDKINSQTRWFATIWIASLAAFAGMLAAILSRLP